jgi:hypothetical protein
MDGAKYLRDLLLAQNKTSGTAVMTKQPTTFTSDGDRIASDFYNVFTNSVAS